MAGHKPRSVTILCKFRVLLDYLSDEDVGQLFKALLEFGANGKRPDFADERTSLGLVFGAISNQIEHDTAKYEKKCRQNSENAKCKGKNAASKEVTACNGKRPQANANDRLQSQTMENGTEAVQSGESSPKSKPVYKKYGAYKHVKLTEEQHKKLVDELGEAKTVDYIRKVDEYCQQHGKTYKDYNLTIRNWARRDSEQNGSAAGINSNTEQRGTSKYSTVF